MQACFKKFFKKLNLGYRLDRVKKNDLWTNLKKIGTYNKKEWLKKNNEVKILANQTWKKKSKKKKNDLSQLN